MPAEIIEDRLAHIRMTSLEKGAHLSTKDAFCVMEAVAYVAGEPWSDHPACSCPVITAFMVSWNDSLPDNAERDRLLKPLVPRLVGTKGSGALERRRAVMAADWYIRAQLPAWLRLAGLSEQAASVEALPEITDFLQCPSLMPVLKAVGADAEAARSAAESAAESAARSAARSAAWSAAESAARSAAESAARSAAESAAESALSDTKTALQQSALDLVNRMIDAQEPQ